MLYCAISTYHCEAGNSLYCKLLHRQVVYIVLTGVHSYHSSSPPPQIPSHVDYCTSGMIQSNYCGNISSPILMLTVMSSVIVTQPKPSAILSPSIRPEISSFVCISFFWLCVTIDQLGIVPLPFLNSEAFGYKGLKWLVGSPTEVLVSIHHKMLCPGGRLAILHPAMMPWFKDLDP